MLKVTDLKCESLYNPLGITTMQPRFSWVIETDSTNVLQKKYHIEVSDSNAIVWDSNEIDSEQSIFVEYAGTPLSYTTRYTWRVRIKIGDVWSRWSDTAWFETALDKWSAPFICADDKPEESDAKIFYSEVTVKKPLESARIYATALGLYEIHVNGKLITDTCFNPGWSSYNSRLLYQSFDVTGLLSEGKNILTACVGAGWYKGDLGHQNYRGVYGTKMAFSSQIDLRYTDGCLDTIKTDKNWKFSDSPIIYSELYHGETYDAGKEKPEDRHRVTIDDTLNYNVEPFDGVPVRRKEVFKPTAFITTPKGERVLDFGQNLAGRVRFNVKGNAGERVKIRHAEILDKEGNFYTENLRSAKCTDEYILKGEGIETYEPIFTFHGYRYVCIDEYPGEVNLENFEAIAIYSDMEPIGKFSCSDALINQLQSNITWGLKGNFLDIPTDCPQRDERLGWTGDAQVFIHTASFLYDILPFFRKWLRDLMLDQKPDGGVPFYIPDLTEPPKPTKNNPTASNHSACGWGDAAVIIPWAIYNCFGDKRLLEQQYPSMKGWVEYIKSKANDNLWNTGFHFADWVALDAKEGSYIGATPADLCATAFYAYSTGLLAKAAKAIGKDSEAKEYENLHADIIKAYQAEFFTENGRLAVMTQTGHILSLMFGLTPEKFIPRTIEALVKLIEDNNGHLVTGFLGTPYFCHVLSNNGKLDEAYALLQREEYPSWLYQVKLGATTIWEHLDGIKEDGSMWSPNMNSFNHYAYGAIGDWLYQVAAGINPQEPGYKKIRIEPNPGGTLTYAEASLKTPYGLLTSKWEQKDGKFHLSAKIPPNTTAEIILPNGEKHTIGSGEYSF